MKVFYSDKLAVDQGQQSFDRPDILQSPSARKPRELADALRAVPNIEFVEPHPVTINDLKLCHNASYVDSIMTLQEDNGFGNKSEVVANSLLYTNGAMYDAAKAATPDMPTAALVAGFHHAGWNCWKGLGYFCTFNGLMIATMKMLQEGANKVAIIDCDMHWGNGTDDILKNLPAISDRILHISFGRHFSNYHRRPTTDNSLRYLKWLDPKGKIYEELSKIQPDVILYQAGADVHWDDPYGGILTTEQMFERDEKMFSIAKELKIPLAWNLAGGYQIEADGSIGKVIELHLNTFRACQKVYNAQSSQ